MSHLNRLCTLTIMFLLCLSPTRFWQPWKQQWANVTTNACLGLTAAEQYNELFKVLLLTFLITLCWNESSWATFLQTDGCWKLLLTVLRIFKHVWKVKHQDTAVSVCLSQTLKKKNSVILKSSGRKSVGSGDSSICRCRFGKTPSGIFCYCQALRKLSHVDSSVFVCP